MTYTPDGIFAVSKSAMDLLWFRDGLVVYPAEEFAKEFHRPEELRARIKKVTTTCFQAK